MSEGQVGGEEEGQEQGEERERERERGEGRLRCYEGQRRVACGREREREREVEREREIERMTERDVGRARPSFAFGSVPSPPFLALLVLVSICPPSEHLSLIYIPCPPQSMRRSKDGHLPWP